MSPLGNSVSFVLLTLALTGVATFGVSIATGDAGTGPFNPAWITTVFCSN